MWPPRSITGNDKAEHSLINRHPRAIILDMEGDNAVRAIVGRQLLGKYAARVDGAIRSPDFILDGKPIEFNQKNGAVLVVHNTS